MKNLKRVNEARIGSALTKAEVPEPYRSMPFVGEGATSVVYADPKDPNFVFVLTKDAIKRDWLVHHWGLNMGEALDIVEPKVLHKSRDLRGYDIFPIRMPLLFKISRSEAKAIKKYTQRYHIIRSSLPRLREAAEGDMRNEKDPRMRKFLEAYLQLIDFLENYSLDQYAFDLHSANIMKNKEGDFILSDPVIDKRILDAIIASKAKQRFVY